MTRSPEKMLADSVGLMMRFRTFLILCEQESKDRVWLHLDPETGKKWRHGKRWNQLEEIANEAESRGISRDRLWVSFSKTLQPRWRVKYHSEKTTPIGIFGYPIDYVIENKINVPSFSDRNYMLILAVKGNPLQFTRYHTDDEWNKISSKDDLIDLIKERNPELYRIIHHNNFELDFDDLGKSSYEKFIYNITKEIAKSFNSERWHAIWTNILKEIGYTGVLDFDTSTIHTSEPQQGVFIDPKHFDHIATIENQKGILGTNLRWSSLDQKHVVDYKKNPTSNELSSYHRIKPSDLPYSLKNKADDLSYLLAKLERVLNHRLSPKNAIYGEMLIKSINSILKTGGVPPVVKGGGSRTDIPQNLFNQIDDFYNRELFDQRFMGNSKLQLSFDRLNAIIDFSPVPFSDAIKREGKNKIMLIKSILKSNNIKEIPKEIEQSIDRFNQLAQKEERTSR